MQACLQTGAYCAIDIHNFARWNGKIIGQDGGPTNDQFADLWRQLATKYKDNEKVIFGLMNEPHDVDITAWAASCQAAVTAIRGAGATTQMILLPGNNFTSAGTFVENGSGAALIGVKNPDGTTTGLILDIHKYLDVDNSGNHAECTTDNTDAFQSVAQFLRDNGRQGLVSETGAGSTDSVSFSSIAISQNVLINLKCFTAFCAQNTFINQNSDVYLGIIAWAAGSFSTSYTLSLTPTIQNGKLVDNKLASQCVVSVWQNAATAVVVSSAALNTGPAASAIASTSAVATQSSASPKTSTGGSTNVPAGAAEESSSNQALTKHTSTAESNKVTSTVAATTGLSTGFRNGSGNAPTTGGSAGARSSTPATQLSSVSSTGALAQSLVIGICGCLAILLL